MSVDEVACGEPRRSQHTNTPTKSSTNVTLTEDLYDRFEYMKNVIKAFSDGAGGSEEHLHNVMSVAVGAYDNDDG
jgi:hypothetical protein